MLRIAIQAKGRLNEESLTLLADAGITASGSHRKLIAKADGFPIDILYLRDDDIPQAVAMGVAQLGIVGQNEVAEKGLQVTQLMPLGFGKCRISLAVRQSLDYPGVQWFNGKRIATSYPAILKGYLNDNKIQADIHTIAGSVEVAPAVGMADAIFDIVSSGGTLVQNSLKEVEEVFQSQAVLIANSNLSQQDTDLTKKLMFRFNSIIQSRGMKYVLFNIPKDAVPRATAIIPGMKSPTILPLANPYWCSMHVVIPKQNLWDKIEQLKELGAEDILVLALENLIR